MANFPSIAKILPVSSDVLSIPITRPFKNGKGSTATVGDVMTWKISTTGLLETQQPSTATRFLPAGIVAGRDVLGQNVENGAFGHLYVSGVVQALVLGHGSMTAGTLLEMVAGQNYLRRRSNAPNTQVARRAFVIMEAYTTTSPALKAVRIDLAGG